MRPLPLPLLLAAAMVEIVSDFGPGGGGEASTGISRGNSTVRIFWSYSPPGQGLHLPVRDEVNCTGDCSSEE